MLVLGFSYITMRTKIIHYLSSLLFDKIPLSSSIYRLERFFAINISTLISQQLLLGNNAWLYYGSAIHCLFIRKNIIDFFYSTFGKIYLLLHYVASIIQKKLPMSTLKNKYSIIPCIFSWGTYHCFMVFLYASTHYDQPNRKYQQIGNPDDTKKEK
jgi:hypothetical protein